MFHRRKKIGMGVFWTVSSLKQAKQSSSKEPGLPVSVRCPVQRYANQPQTIHESQENVSKSEKVQDMVTHYWYLVRLEHRIQSSLHTRQTSPKSQKCSFNDGVCECAFPSRTLTCVVFMIFTLCVLSSSSNICRSLSSSSLLSSLVRPLELKCEEFG